MYILFVSLNNNYKTTRANACIRNRYVAQISSRLVFGMYSEQSSLADIYHAMKDVKEIKINLPGREVVVLGEGRAML